MVRWVNAVTLSACRVQLDLIYVIERPLVGSSLELRSEMGGRDVTWFVNGQ